MCMCIKKKIIEIFEFFKNTAFSRTTFLRKVRDTNIDSKNIVKFYSAHFDI